MSLVASPGTGGAGPEAPGAPYGKLLWLASSGKTRADYPFRENMNIIEALDTPEGRYVVH